MEDFLRTPEKKISLIPFLVDQLQEPTNIEKLQDESLFVTCGETSYLLTKDQWQEMQALQTEEEADTRMLLHARHATKDGFKSIVINTEDTDVLILCISYSKKLACSLYQMVHRTSPGK